jgi:hypothetical protein
VSLQKIVNNGQVSISINSATLVNKINMRECDKPMKIGGEYKSVFASVDIYLAMLEVLR